MKYFLYILLVFLVIGCKQPDGKNNRELNNNSYNCVDLERWQNEILDIDSVRINGMLPVISSKKEIIKVFGLPTKSSIVSFNSGVFSSIIYEPNLPVERLYFGNTIFDVLDSVAILRVLDLKESQVELHCDSKNVLSSKTTSIDFCKLFPESCKLMANSQGYMISGTMQLNSSKYLSKYNIKWFVYIDKEYICKLSLIDVNDPFY